MDLTTETCVPCKGDIPALNDSDIAALHKSVSEWEVSEDLTRISRRFLFKNFAQALDFVTQIGTIAEEQNHHPDILFGWGYAHVSLQTHAIGGLHKNDFIVAARIDAL